MIANTRLSVTNNSFTRVQHLIRLRMKVTGIIVTHYLSGDAITLVQPLVREFFLHLSGVGHRGLPFLIKYIKTSRNLVARYLSGSPLKSDPIVALSRSGLPSWLSSWESLLTSDDAESRRLYIRVIFTCLTSFRTVQLKPSLELSTISDYPNGNHEEISDREIAFALYSLAPYWRKFSSWPEWPGFHLTTKKGPQGQAIALSLSELTLVPSELLSDISLVGGDKLRTAMEENTDRLDILGWGSVASWWKSLFPTKSAASLRKLSYFADKEGKTRVIAILDYWSQSAMRGLHMKLNRFLRGLHSDCTFNQNAFSHILSLQGRRFDSIDLSAATDRMPLALQRRVLSILFGDSSKSEAWARILVSIPYFNKDIPLKGNAVYYNTGQPMGAYSSWPAMALTHHIIVQVAALRVGINRFKDYALLGDDLVIVEPQVAESYKRLISLLGMPYSAEKTHTSFEMFEFAKRWFYQGHEVSGFSVGGLLSTVRKYPLLVNFLENQASHGWQLSRLQAPAFFSAVIRVVNKRFPVSQVARYMKLFLLLSYILDFKRNPGIQEGRALLDYVQETFALDSNWLGWFNTDPVMTIKLAIALAKMNIAERDLYSFQNDAYSVNNRLNTFVQDRISLSKADNPETVSFLKETLSVVLNWNNPIVITLNEMIDKSIDFMTRTMFVDEALGPDMELILISGLAKYRVNKGVFSLRQSASLPLADSASVKALIEVFKATPDPKNFIVPSLGINPNIPPMSAGIPAIRWISFRQSTLLRYFDFVTGAFCILFFLQWSGLDVISHISFLIWDSPIIVQPLTETLPGTVDVLPEVVEPLPVTLESPEVLPQNGFPWVGLIFGLGLSIILVVANPTGNPGDLIEFSPVSPLESLASLSDYFREPPL